MEEESYINTNLSKDDKFNKLSNDNQQLVVNTELSCKVLIDAIDKYEQAVKQCIDPEISREETILIVSALIKKMANSLPSYLEEEPGMKQGIISLIQEMREKGLQMNNPLKEQFIKFLVRIRTIIQPSLTKSFSFIRFRRN
ncbi:hypothetical protein [Mastigocladopsis repens]|uniref:hypothetical protein n=1 Tax=Mastigocladopsis repens TaxID=221287 RepID=UPI0002EFE2FD|nr:hypothetical protein [Mastigocladopsis repens]